MAFPTVATRSTGASGTTDTTTHAITMPTGINAGDLLLIVFSSDGIPTCSASAGWLKLGQASDTTNVVTQAVFFKWAAGSDTCTVTTSVAEQSTHVVLRIPTGGVPSVVFLGGNSTNSNPPSANLGYAQDYLWIATRSGDSTTVATAAPTNYANLQSRAAAGTGGASTNTAERALNATTEDPGTFTSATEQWVSATISIATDVSLGARTTIDDFNDGTVNNSNTDGFGWEQWGTPSPNSVESGGQLTITSTTGGTYHGMNQWATRVLNESYLGSEMVSVGNQALASLEVYPIACEQIGSSDLYYTFIGTNLVYAYTNIAATALLRGVAQPYNPVIHRWFAVGETGGEIVWLHSPDGSHWRRQVAIADPTGGTFQPQGEIMIGTWQAEATATAAVWDNFSGWGLPVASTGAAALSAVSGLAAGATSVSPGAAALTAASDLAAAATPAQPGAAALTVVSNLTAAATPVRPGASALSAASNLTAAATRVQLAMSALTAASSLAAAATRVTSGTAALTAASGLSAGAVAAIRAAAALSAASQLTAGGVRAVPAASVLSAVSALTAGGTRFTTSAAVLSAASGLVADSGGQQSAAAVFSAVSALTAGGLRTVPGAALLSAASSLTAGAVGSSFGAVSLSAASTLAVSAAAVRIAAVALTAASSLVAASASSGQAAAVLTAVSGLVADASSAAPGSGATVLTAEATLAAAAVLATGGSVQLAAVSALLVAVQGDMTAARGTATTRRSASGVVLLGRAAGTARVVRASGGEVLVG